MMSCTYYTHYTHHTDDAVVLSRSMTTCYTYYNDRTDDATLPQWSHHRQQEAPGEPGKGDQVVGMPVRIKVQWWRRSRMDQGAARMLPRMLSSCCVEGLQA